MSSRGWRRFGEAEIFAHVTVVLFLPVLRAQVQAKFVNHFDAEVPQPVVPAVGADRGLDAATHLVGQRGACQPVSAIAGRATGSLTDEAVARGLRAAGRLLRRWHRGA